MAPMLLRNVSNSIWHAFHALSSKNEDFVLKSRLKVLTANIGTILDLYGVEKGLDHFRSTMELNFEDFKYYLESEVFSSLPKAMQLRESQIFENKIEDICWLVCRKEYLGLDLYCLPTTTVYHLFRVFCFLSDLVPVPGSEAAYQVIMHTSEVNKLCCDLSTSLGLEWEDSDKESLQHVTGSFKFPTFISFIKQRFGQTVSPEAFQEAVAEVYQTHIHDIIKKGPLYRKGYLIPTLKEYWFVLRTTELSYFKGRSNLEPCGSITLDPHLRVTSPPNTNKEKFQRIVIVGSERSFELATIDHKSRLQWVSALQLAIQNSGGSESYQRRQCTRRRLEREAGTLRIREETLRRASQSLEIQHTRERLRKEIEARIEADKKARDLQTSLEKQENEARELLDVRNRLEKLLEEEIQAKRDEEIVRSLQARVLNEEWERREELERLQSEQRRLLEEERQKREAFERIQAQKEEQLRAAEDRLRELEMERQKLDKELKFARDKISASENSKHVLETQLRLAPLSKEPSDRVRRALSFVESTKDRPVIQIRTTASSSDKE